MSLQFKDEKWTVCFYENHVPTFERLISKDDVMKFVQELKEERSSTGCLSLNDVTIFPPKTDLELEEVALYNVPKMFLGKD